MASRIGQFLFFVGLIMLVIFFATDQARTPVFPLFCGGLVVFIFGIILIWRFREPPPKADRFRSLRKGQEKKKK